MNRKTWAWTIGAVVLLAGGIWAAVYYWPASPPDVEKAAPQELLVFAARPEFQKLDADQQRQVMEKAREGGREAWENLSEAQRDQLRDNMRASWRQRQDAVVQRYMDAPTPEDKKAVLDEIIDDMQERMAERAQRRQERPEDDRPQRPEGERPNNDDNDRRRGERQRRAPDLDRVKRWVERSSPEREAFHQALIERMRERGIEWGRGPGRGGPRNG